MGTLLEVWGRSFLCGNVTISVGTLLLVRGR